MSVEFRNLVTSKLYEVITILHWLVMKAPLLDFFFIKLKTYLGVAFLLPLIMLSNKYHNYSCLSFSIRF